MFGLPSGRTIAGEIIWFYLVAACVKLLLFPSYRSTDFEVHRHWLALTHSLPLENWYSDETSQWTLDYPPFFAHFEHFLSLFARMVDPTIVDLHKGLNYSAPSVVIFQRITVIAADIVLLLGTYRLTRNLDSLKRNLVWVMIIFSSGLLIVDHIHFQYNGFLLGILLLSLSFLQEGNDLMGGFLFSVLLCFKHLFAVAAPVYFVYLLRHYCRGGILRSFGKLMAMGTLVLVVFLAAYGPFVYHGQIQQVLHRMFPFGRGLCHAYWAPNFWVFYIISDKTLAFILTKLGFIFPFSNASFTGGLVGDSSPFAVLPTVTPLLTFVSVLLAISPCIIKCWMNPQPKMIVRWVSYAYTCGFLFGWHVHEKASLHFVIPLAIVAVQSADEARHYFLLSIVSTYSLFPLLFESQEYPIKVILLFLHSLLLFYGFSSQFPGDKKNAKNGDRFNMGWIEKTYLFGLVLVEIWCRFLHTIILGNKLPFLPLMMMSLYCGFGMLYSWIWQLRRIIELS